jgi:hypothetical protein
MTGDPLGYGPRNKGTALDQSVSNTKQSAAEIGLAGSKKVIDKRELTTALDRFSGSTNSMTNNYLDAGEREIPGFKDAVAPSLRGGQTQFNRGIAKQRSNITKQGSNITKQGSNLTKQDLTSK